VYVFYKLIFSLFQAPLIYTARFISGIALGAGSVITPIYCEEIAEVRLRGALGVLFELQVCNGILFVYVVGAYLSYIWLSIACAIIPAVSFLTFVWMPESPMYLAAKGKKIEAEKSLRWLRGARYITDYDLQPELERIYKFVSQTKTESPSQGTSSRAVITQIVFTMKEISKLLFSLSPSPTKRAVIITTCLMIFRQLCGINAVIFYTADIFTEAGGILSPSLATIIAGISQIVATYISSLLVERTGRRLLLFLSNVTMAVSHVLLAVHFYFKQMQSDAKIFGWLPLLCVVIYMAGFNIGFGPLPWLIMAELLPSKSKSWASGLAVFVNWILVFAVTHLYGNMMENLGPMITFGIFGGMCTLGILVVALILPETKGKTREEIQLELRRI
jgi:SP family facilitated glucose transporter-like MFS transporter 8